MVSTFTGWARAVDGPIQKRAYKVVFLEKQTTVVLPIPNLRGGPGA
jgi:hypothetical protein